MQGNAMKYGILNKNVLDVDYPEKTFDAVFCDPPYELGFMGKKWDKSGIANNVDFWRKILASCKPGAHLLTFGGTRTYHRMTCAIEDAGFEIRDCLSWLYGQGFPKSLNLGNGYGTALKPAHEPIVLARVPLDGTVAENVTGWGCGALAIEAARVPGLPRDPATKKITASSGSGNVYLGSDGEKQIQYGQKLANGLISGRWPTNVILDEDSAKQFDASRFFYTAKVSSKERNAGLEDMPILSGGDATDREDGSKGLENPRAGAGRGGGSRNPHPTLKPIKLTEYLAKLVLPPNGGRILIPFSGVGSEIIGASLAGWPEIIGIEQDPLYVQIAHKRILYWCGHLIS